MTGGGQNDDCMKITFVNRTNGIAMDVLKYDPGTKKETPAALLTGRSLTVQPKEIVSASIGDQFVIRDDSDKRLLDRVRIGPNRFEADGAASAEGYLSFERAPDSNDWILKTSGKNDRRLKLLRNNALDVELFDARSRELFYLPVKGGVLTRRRSERERAPTATPGGGGQPFRVKPVFSDHSIFVGWSNKPIDSSNVRNARLKTEYPSFTSYDATLWNPMRPKDAFKGAVFAQLSEEDTDYVVVDGDTFVRIGMTLDATCYGDGETTARFISDTRTLATEWSVGVTLGVGDDTTKYSGTASASYKEAFNRITTSEAYYSIARELNYAYDISLDPFIVPVADQFRNAVHYLPEPAAATQPALAKLTDDLASDADKADAVKAAVNDPAYPAYRDFVTSWGTHYPTSIRYGSATMQMLSYDSARVQELSSKGFNASLEAKGSIKGVPVTGKVEGGYSRTEGFDKVMKDELARKSYVGTSDEPQPIRVAFAPLSDLLDPAILQDDSIYDDWRWRAPMLRAAIRAHCGGAEAAEDLDVRVFEMEMLGFAPAGRKDEKSLYGWLDLIWVADSVKPAGKTRIWDRSKAGGSRVNFHANSTALESTWVQGTSPRVMQVFRAKDYEPDKAFAACISMIDYNTSSGLGDYANPYRITFGGIEKQTRLLTGDGPRGERLTGDWTQADLQSGRMTMRVRYRETPLWLVPPEALKPLRAKP